MRVLLLAGLALIVVAVMQEMHAPMPVPPGGARVRLDQVPPDACLELFGPGPCRPHGSVLTTGWTEAVAGPPPEGWRGKAR